MLTPDPSPSPRPGSKLDSLSREDLLKFLKKQQVLLQKTKTENAELKKQAEALNSWQEEDEDKSDQAAASGSRVSELEAQLKQRENEAKELDQEKSTLSERLETLAAQLRETEAQLNQAKSAETTLSNELDACKSKCADIESQLEEIENEGGESSSVMADLRRKLVESEDEIASLSMDNDDLTRKLDRRVEELESQINDLRLENANSAKARQMLESQNQELKESSSKVAEFMDLVDKQKAELESLKCQLAEAQESPRESETLRPLVDKNDMGIQVMSEPVDVDLKDDDEIAQAMKLRIQELEEALESLRNELAQSEEKAMTERTELRKELDDVEEKWTAEADARLSFEEKFVNSEDRLSQNVESMKKLEQTLSEARSDLGTKQERIRELEQLLEKEREKSSGSDVWGLELADCQQSISKLQQQIGGYEKHIEHLNGLISSKDNEKDSLEKHLGEVQRRCSNQEDLVAQLRKELSSYQQQVTQRISEDEAKKIEHGSLNDQLRNAQTEIEKLKLDLSEAASSNKSEIDRLKQSVEARQANVDSLSTSNAKLTQELKMTKGQLNALNTEYASYREKVQVTLRQKRHDETNVSWEAEKAHMTKTVELMQDKLREMNASFDNAKQESASLRQEVSALSQGITDCRADFAAKEAHLKSQVDKAISDANHLASKHSETVKELTSSREAMAKEFEERCLALQAQNRSATLAQQERVDFYESEIAQLKTQLSEVTKTPREPLKLFIPSQESDESQPSNLPPPLSERHPGVGSEATDDTPKLSPTSAAAPAIPRLDELIRGDVMRSITPASPSASSVVSLPSNPADLTSTLAASVKKIEHLNEVLNESESTNSRFVEQNKILKEEIRRLQRNEERTQHVLNNENAEYLKNVILKFFSLSPGDERSRLIPVLQTMLKLSPDEVATVRDIANGGEGSSEGGNWTGYLHRWTGLTG